MRRRLSALLLALGLTFAGGAVRASAQPRERWVGTWGTAANWRPPTADSTQSVAPPPAAAAGAPTPVLLHASNQTLRQILRTSIKGDRVRVVFSNTFGTLPITIGAAHVARREAESALVAGSGRRLLFGGRAQAVIPAGAILVSDPVALVLPAMADLAIDVYLPGDTATWNSPLTVHRGAFTTSYVSASGNHAGETPFPSVDKMTTWWLLSRVEVVAPAPARAIVTFGDSITDGTRSTIDGNRRWPDVLSRRLRAQPSTASLAIVNEGIAGNRLLAEASPNLGVNALARFDRDVLAQPGAAYVIVLEGINDLGMARPEARPSAEDLIGAYRQLIDRAHAQGLTIYGATLTPFEGAAYFTPEGEVTRQAVNQWIRTGGAFDAVIDFDKVTRDPASPTKFLPAYDSGDHLHPNDVGYEAMGASIDLALFK